MKRNIIASVLILGGSLLLGTTVYQGVAQLAGSDAGLYRDRGVNDTHRMERADMQERMNRMERSGMQMHTNRVERADMPVRTERSDMMEQSGNHCHNI
ncbi:hypothetical protein [Paenibacillus apiarius]|uniref:Uncharacterized protein n=1 Tax=Paenibacillus apiarius TaxID=46240 RepID=A0ABT4DRZ6_9BACL|nr:hypothetical protein [Paenibacillus apiarius]MBN3524610.1 hypothetical protein [Paenibacillus apiarius]MCY9514290.1 hypothetical protein [Paenibacillus apiarius]MCY9520127.1 hypothetical protein [Paenibacillus apiarius]MCY9550134.1 hypothetical protein [Paenibacillus apiarius]MCY9560255.1 hypothetical protein [Paenibacillus apiarius]